jgi:hypothetical protein
MSLRDCRQLTCAATAARGKAASKCPEAERTETRTVDRCSLDSMGGGTYASVLPGLSWIPQNIVSDF